MSALKLELDALEDGIWWCNKEIKAVGRKRSWPANQKAAAVESYERTKQGFLLLQERLRG